MRKTRMAIFTLILIPLLVAGGFGIWLRGALSTPFGSYPDGGKFITIARGESRRAIARRLAQEGIISQPWSFLMYGAWKPSNLQAGEYYFDAPASQLEIIDKLAKGRVYQHPITVPEGVTMAEIADIAAQSGLVTQEAMLAEMNKTDLIKDLDPKARNLEGYLFPDTYLFPRRVSAQDVVKRMVRRFHDVFNAQHVEKARSLGLTVRQAVILASLIEKETAVDAERPLVSGVLQNRLRLGMLLQCDPTIIYGLTKEGRYPGRLNRAALQSDTPYNTYRYPGLPPGPIANAGKKSLDAAVNPADGSLLYFVSKNDGTHYFSASLAEHNRAVQQYQQRANGGR